MNEQRKTQHFLKGQAIVTEGTVGDRTYRILTGDVLVCKENREGNMVPIAKLGAGEFFGEMYLFEAGNRRSATVVAGSSEVVVEVLFREEMQELIGPVSPALSRILLGYQQRLQVTSGLCAGMTEGVSMTKLPDGRLKTTERGNGFTLRPDGA